MLCRPILWIWKKIRLILPFSLKRKAEWNVSEHLEAIGWAIEETDKQQFEQELRVLYSRIEKYGLKMPLIDPVSIGDQNYDSTWQWFHLSFLKVLRRWVRNNEFVFDQWNTDVDRENAERARVLRERLRSD